MDGADLTTTPAAGWAAGVASGPACLLLIARRAGLAPGENELLALGGREPSAAELATCAAAAGFRAQALSLDWRHLQDLGRALPAIVTFRDGRRLMLTRIAGRGETPDVTLVDPAAPSGATTMLRAAFELAWTGETVLLKPIAAPVEVNRPLGWGMVAAVALGEPRLLRELGLSIVLSAVLAAGPILAARTLVGDVMVADARGTLAFVLSGLMAVVAFEGAFAVLRGRVAGRLAAACGQRLNAAALARLLKLPLTDQQAVAPGETVRRLTQLDTLEAFVGASLPRTLQDAGVSIMLLPVMAWFSLPLTALVVAVAVAALGTCALLAGRQARTAKALRGAVDEAARALDDTATHRDAVLALGLAPQRRRLWDVLVARVTRGRLADAAAGNLLDVVAATAEGAIRYAPVVLGVLLAMNHGGPGALADLFAFTLAAWRFAAPLNEAGPRLRSWAAARDAMAEVAAWADAPAAPEPAAMPITATAWAGHVAFQEVGFTFAEAPGPALRAVSFAAEAGTLVGIVGRGGAGKSTLLRLLGRQLDGAEGLIKLDGIDIRAMPAEALCRAVAVVDDDAAWFPGTLHDNLVVADPEVSAAALREALALTGAADVVDRLPDGLATVLEGNTLGVSDGEGQRLAIARALLGRPAVLALDNATAALDPAAEARLFHDLRSGGRLTMVVVTQRLTSLAQADAVLVLDGGELQDMGHHHDLVMRSDLYNGLWQRRVARPGAGRDALPAPDVRAA